LRRCDKPAKLPVLIGEKTMTKTLAIIAALAFTLTAAPTFAAGGAPYKLDAKGKCHASDGKYAKQSLCSAAAPAAPKHCKDPKTKKFTKCSAPGAVPA